LPWHHHVAQFPSPSLHSLSLLLSSLSLLINPHICSPRMSLALTFAFFSLFSAIQ
jgi:hypothetical protein